MELSSDFQGSEHKVLVKRKASEVVHFFWLKKNISIGIIFMTKNNHKYFVKIQKKLKYIILQHLIKFISCRGPTGGNLNTYQPGVNGIWPLKIQIFIFKTHEYMYVFGI